MDAFFSLILFTGLIFAIMEFAAPPNAYSDTRTTPHHELQQVASSGHLPEGVDPVCGTTVAAHEGILVAHQGVEYRFCSLACVETFEKDKASPSRRAA